MLIAVMLSSIMLSIVLPFTYAGSPLKKDHGSVFTTLPLSSVT